MGIFGAILDKLRHHGSAAAAQGAGPLSGSSQQQTQPPAQSAGQAPGGVQNTSAGTPQTQPPSGMQGSSGSQASLQNVDVDAVLSQLASQKGGGGNYRESIVDLLKLLDLDSSLSARKALAQELNVHAGADGSAEQNIALHKAVMRKIEENGGKVPDSMRH
ncbi:MAG: DUF3597 domain-containing protein [Rhodospirillaceae bacterium]